MHHDDSIQTVSLAGRRVLVVRCDEAGRCDRPAVAAAWRSTDAELLWLTADGAGPTESVVGRSDDGVIVASLEPVVDAVKSVDVDGVILRTVERSTLSTVVPPALLPRPVVDQVLAAEGTGSLLADAVRRSTVVALRPGG